MDDNNKMVNPVQPQVPSAQPALAQPAGHVQIPTGSVNKEMGPVGLSSSQLTELQPTGAEVSHNISQELKDLGVEESKDKPDLTQEHKQIGVDHAGPHVPAPSSFSGKVSLPMSEEEISKQLKTGRGDDSGKWLARLIQKIIKAMGI